jgi:glucose-6-phosphate dehydrogenase assembly protein OpcA
MTEVVTGTQALTATLIAVGPPERLTDPADALEQLTSTAAIRGIVISYGTDPQTRTRTAGRVIALDGLRPEYVNNAVAGLRLSSLPSIVWWRGGETRALQGLAELADRIVLDAEDPLPVWRAALPLVERTAVSDLRWTRLTRWRALMAHFFDIAEVHAAANGFDRLEVAGSDVHAAGLFAAWLTGELEAKDRIHVDLQQAAGVPIRRIRIGNARDELTLELAPNGKCVHTAARVEGHANAHRTVSLGDQSTTALLAEELRIRSRDEPFERAMRSLCTTQPH